MSWIYFKNTVWLDRATDTTAQMHKNLGRLSIALSIFLKKSPFWCQNFGYQILRRKNCTLGFKFYGSNQGRNFWPWKSKFAFFGEKCHLDVDIFDFKICGAFFALDSVTLKSKLLRNFLFICHARLDRASPFYYFPHDIAPFRKVWSVWKFWDSSLILTTETTTFKPYENKTSAHVPIGAWVVCGYCMVGCGSPQ